VHISYAHTTLFASLTLTLTQWPRYTWMWPRLSENVLAYQTCSS